MLFFIPFIPIAHGISSENLIDLPNVFVTIGGVSIDDNLIAPFTNIENITSQFGIEVSFTELIAYSIGMVIYGIFIWNFYRFIARREMIPLGLKKYQTDGKKITSVIAYIFKYVIVFPLVVLIWFVVYSTFLFFMAPDIPKEHVFLIVISLVVTVRISAYYKEDLAKDFAKLIPFALLGIFLTSNIFFTPSDIIDRAYGFIPFLGNIVGFVIYAIIVEAILRILFLVKRKILPTVEEKLEEKIEEQINEKIKVHVEKIENKHNELEKKIEKENNSTKNGNKE
ncbi:MAG: hypothetical protein OEM28_01265 [Nitrosopumilus sp.]|nr:hypothetical protein [Nitrosopumilus sp.]MDH3486496.1 hypothetical protein [Nitrosopumilus sp.]